MPILRPYDKRLLASCSFSAERSCAGCILSVCLSSDEMLCSSVRSWVRHFLRVFGSLANCRSVPAIDDEFLNIYSVADTYLPWLVGVPFPLGTKFCPDSEVGLVYLLHVPSIDAQLEMVCCCDLCAKYCSLFFIRHIYSTKKLLCCRKCQIFSNTIV